MDDKLQDITNLGELEFSTYEIIVKLCRFSYLICKAIFAISDIYMCRSRFYAINKVLSSLWWTFDLRYKPGGR